MSLSRRRFIAGLGTLAAASTLPLDPLPSTSQPPLYPPVDLSYFDRSITPSSGQIRFGYAAITWGGNDFRAIQEISEIGFRGVQLRNNLLNDYGDRPKALRDLLEQHHLEMVPLSSGSVSIAAGTENDEIAKDLRNAKIVQAVGGVNLAVAEFAPAQKMAPATQGL